MGKKLDFTAKINYPKITEEARDFGPGTGGDVDKKLALTEGQYNAVLILSEETKEYLINEGCPVDGLSAALWKQTPEGEPTYKVKRPHVNPKLKDKDTGEPMYFGPPTVIVQGEGGNVPYDVGTHGYIANGNEVKVRLDVDKKWGIVVLEAIKFLDFERYESEPESEEEMLENF